MRALVACRVAAVSSIVQRGQGPCELVVELAAIAFWEPQKGHTALPERPSRMTLALERSSDTGTPPRGEPDPVGAIGSVSRAIG